MGVGWKLGDERVVEQETGERPPLEVFDETRRDEVVELTTPIGRLVQLRRRIPRYLPTPPTISVMDTNMNTYVAENNDYQLSSFGLNVS